MLNGLKRFIKTTYYLTRAFFGGMKNTEDIVLHQSGINGIDGTLIGKQVNDNRISKALLQGELTEEVQELRYRTYKVDREAKDFEYFSPTLSKRRDKQDTKFISYDKSDGLRLITIQPNAPQVENIYDSLKRVNGGYGDIKYWIKVTRDGFVPRYRIEEYTKLLAVKEMTDSDRVVLEFYVSMYPNEVDLKSKGFISEIKYIRDEGRKSDMTILDTVSFTTSHAYGKDDMLKYTFDGIVFSDIKEFDGHYVIRFTAKVKDNGYDLTKQYYSASMDEKYKTNARKEINVSSDDVARCAEYKCEECGKTVKYNPTEIEMMNADTETQRYGVTEFMDLQISEQTFGKKLCKDCLKKYLDSIQ